MPKIITITPDAPKDITTEMFEMLRDILETIPPIDPASEFYEDQNEINGGDTVDYLCEIGPQIRELLDNYVVNENTTLNTLRAAWHFIENVTDDDPARNEKFFALREQVRNVLWEGRKIIIPNLAVIMEGGLVQHIVSDYPNLLPPMNVMVLDFDVDGANDDRITTINRNDGIQEEAFAQGYDIELATFDLAAVNKFINDDILLPTTSDEGTLTTLPEGTEPPVHCTQCPVPIPANCPHSEPLPTKTEGLIKKLYCTVTVKQAGVVTDLGRFTMIETPAAVMCGGKMLPGYFFDYRTLVEELCNRNLVGDEDIANFVCDFIEYHLNEGDTRSGEYTPEENPDVTITYVIQPEERPSSVANPIHVDAKELEACLRRCEASLTTGSADEPDIREVMLNDIRITLGIV